MKSSRARKKAAIKLTGQWSADKQMIITKLNVPNVKVMRITKLITKGRTLWSWTKFSQLLLKEMYGDWSGEFWILNLNTEISEIESMSKLLGSNKAPGVQV